MHIVHRMPADANVKIDTRNSRVMLLDCGRRPDATVAAAVDLAAEQGSEKIWGFVHPEQWVTLAQMGFVREGLLDGYYDDAPGVGVARYLNGARGQSKHAEQEDAIIARLQSLAGDGALEPLPADYRLRPAKPADAGAVARVLRAVFASYPTPIETAEDIRHAMAHDVVFHLVEYQGEAVGVASADVDRAHRVAEMTDCATLPDFRGKGLARRLLQGLEEEMRRQRLRSLFTLARATSIAMNTTFARLGYSYRGRFINNCHIAGDWEDMNLWVKVL